MFIYFIQILNGCSFLHFDLLVIMFLLCMATFTYITDDIAFWNKYTVWVYTYIDICAFLLFLLSVWQNSNKRKSATINFVQKKNILKDNKFSRYSGIYIALPLKCRRNYFFLRLLCITCENSLFERATDFSVASLLCCKIGTNLRKSNRRFECLLQKIYIRSVGGR